MKKIVNFLVKIGNLKEMPRRGWVINNIKNPESIADHTFRATLMAWVLGKKKGLNIERLLKIALVHDLCEVYAGDATPYDFLLSKNPKKRKEIMKTWPRLSSFIKEKITIQKHKKEKKALEKLIKDLPSDLGAEIEKLWFDYEKGVSREGRFFKQADRLESFLQAMEYWKRFKKPPQGPWWEWAIEFFDDPLLLEFIEAMTKELKLKK